MSLVHHCSISLASPLERTDAPTAVLSSSRMNPIARLTERVEESCRVGRECLGNPALPEVGCHNRGVRHDV